MKELVVVVVDSCAEVVEVPVRSVVVILDEVEVTTSVDVCVEMDVVVVVPPVIPLATSSLVGLLRRSGGHIVLTLSAGNATTFAQFESSKLGFSHPATKVLVPTHRVLEPVTNVSVCAVP